MTWTFLGTLGVGSFRLRRAGGLRRGIRQGLQRLRRIDDVGGKPIPGHAARSRRAHGSVVGGCLEPAAAAKGVAQGRMRSLGWLSLGAGIATPLGVLLLASFSAGAIRVFIAIVVLVGSFLIWRGANWVGQPGTLTTITVGLAFGVLNGSTALGGPPVVLFYLATPIGAAVGRASIIVFFLATDAMAAGSQAFAGVLSLEVLAAAGSSSRSCWGECGSARAISSRPILKTSSAFPCSS